MNFVTAQPESLSLAAQNSASTAPMTSVVPAAADVVSILTAAQFAKHGLMFQTVNAQAAVLHENFVNTLQASAGSYAATQTINAASAR
ncbi:PE family protein [Mycobacterium sp. 94-17]|uniref:PE family protein n=1 Tax=Mycobacterium sp. 94-17 TaxID=2986147 RepID=UPI002D1F9498|nr:PE family protein [Mycobacterium sp. 94-17]MEB4210020.1 PE family protein [Mycobacterium sp. 94-17]